MLEAFAKLPDPRSPHGRRHPLPAILALSVAAMLSGARSLYAIFPWGRLQPPEAMAIHRKGLSGGGIRRWGRPGVGAIGGKEG